MLTPQEISGKEFVKAVFGGYDMSAVDEFLETITADYTALYKENTILKSKIKVLVEKVEEYRSTEDAMRMALLTAQKMGDDMVKEAKEKSGTMLKSAKEEADAALLNMQAQIIQEEARLNAAKKATAAFIAENNALIEKLQNFLKAVPNLELKAQPAQKKEPPVPTKEEKIMDTVHDIDNAVSKITEEETAPAAETKAQAKPQYNDEDESDYTSPRPKFDFDNLRFGKNYTDMDE